MNMKVSLEFFRLYLILSIFHFGANAAGNTDVCYKHTSCKTCISLNSADKCQWCVPPTTKAAMCLPDTLRCLDSIPAIESTSPDCTAELGIAALTPCEECIKKTKTIWCETAIPGASPTGICYPEEFKSVCDAAATETAGLSADSKKVYTRTHCNNAEYKSVFLLIPICILWFKKEL